MRNSVYYKVQFCDSYSDWTDYPKKFFLLPAAEQLAMEISSRSHLFSSRVIRIEETLLNEFCVY